MLKQIFSKVNLIIFCRYLDRFLFLEPVFITFFLFLNILIILILDLLGFIFFNNIIIILEKQFLHIHLKRFIKNQYQFKIKIHVNSNQYNLKSKISILRILNRINNGRNQKCATIYRKTRCLRFLHGIL